MSDPTQETVQPGEYSTASITVLEGLEAVRKRPGMYVGVGDVQRPRNLGGFAPAVKGMDT